MPTLAAFNEETKTGREFRAVDRGQKSARKETKKKKWKTRDALGRIRKRAAKSGKFVSEVRGGKDPSKRAGTGPLPPSGKEKKTSQAGITKRSPSAERKPLLGPLMDYQARRSRKGTGSGPRKRVRLKPAESKWEKEAKRTNHKKGPSVCVLLKRKLEIL